MPKKASKQSFKQLNYSERSLIEAWLRTNRSFNDIAIELNRSRQTIYREVLARRYAVSYDSGYLKTSCKHFLECHQGKRKLDMECPIHCKNYQMGAVCSRIKKSHYVCNSCPRKNKGSCNFLHYFYSADYASNDYHKNYSSSHAILKVDKTHFEKIKPVIASLVAKGQSPEAIVMNHPEFNVAAATIRDWISKRRIPGCYLSMLRFPNRRSPNKYQDVKHRNALPLLEEKVEHQYQDYLNYIKTHPNALITQCDTVVGGLTKGKSILTIHLVQYHFQFGILLTSHTAEEVVNRLKELLDKLLQVDDEYGTILFRRVAECVLCDNGSEFNNMMKLEKIYDDKNTHIFYTRAYASYDKGACEKNHVLVRYIHHKGHSWDHLEQKDIDLMFSHINSYPRKSLQKKTPYDLVLQHLGKEFLDIIGINKINPDDVTLKPTLF